MKITDIFKKVTGGFEPDKTQKTYTCSGCKQEFAQEELEKNGFICPSCSKYIRMSPKERIKFVCDEGSFSETDADAESHNILAFPEYEDKLESAKKASGEKDGVTCGIADIGGIRCAVFVMNAYFMMGSMGVVVGEKITRLFEKATEMNIPVIGFTASGGARMQEGIFSLMQMAKVSGAVKRHSDAGLLYIAVLTDPTTGGVTASFAMEADITLAEPKALIGFAGARVIKETTGGELPPGFQRAEFLLEHGFVDAIVERRDLKKTLTELLALHGKEN